MERPAQRIREVARDDQGRPAHAFHAVNKHRAKVQKVVEVAERVMKLLDVVSRPVDQFDTPPGQPMPVHGVVRPAVQRQDTGDPGGLEMIQPPGVIDVPDCDPLGYPVQPLN